MSSDELKSLLKRITEEASNNGEYAVINELLAPNFITHNFNVVPGPQGYIQFLTLLRNAFPDFHIETEDMIAEGNKVVSRGTITGTHKGDFLNIMASGNKLEFTYIDLWRMEEGKFVESWLIADMLKLLQQIEVAPQTD